MLSIDFLLNEPLLPECYLPGVYVEIFDFKTSSKRIFYLYMVMNPHLDPVMVAQFLSVLYILLNPNLIASPYIFFSWIVLGGEYTEGTGALHVLWS